MPTKTPRATLRVKDFATAIEEEDQGLVMLETETNYFDVLENAIEEGKPEDIVRIFDINNEGFARKEIHLAIEREVQISIYCNKYSHYNLDRVEPE